MSPWPQSKVSTAVVVANFLFFQRDTAYISIHPRQENHNRQKYKYYYSQFGDPRSFIGVAYRNMGEGSHYSRMTVRQLHHQNPSVYAGLKAGNLELTAQPAGSSAG